jgi:hypothetical protein
VDRESQGWTKQARSGPVGGLVWSGLARAGERRGEEESLVGLAAGLGWSGFAMRLPHDKTTHAIRIFALLGVSVCGFGFLKPHS